VSKIESSFDEILSNLLGEKEMNEEIEEFENCMRFILIKKNATGPFDDENCREIEKRMDEEGGDGDRECIEKAPEYFRNIKVNLREIVAAENLT
jgi:5'(3')-deoxyribonucleotidase